MGKLPKAKKKAVRKTPRKAVTSNSVAGQKVLANSKRAQYNKKVNQQQHREKIAAAGHLGRVQVCLKRLEVMGSQVSGLRGMTREQQAKYITETGMIKTRLDAHFKMINKFLPDIRTIDFRNEEGDNPLSAAIEAWSKALNQ